MECASRESSPDLLLLVGIDSVLVPLLDILRRRTCGDLDCLLEFLVWGCSYSDGELLISENSEKLAGETSRSSGELQDTGDRSGCEQESADELVTLSNSGEQQRCEESSLGLLAPAALSERRSWEGPGAAKSLSSSEDVKSSMTTGVLSLCGLTTFTRMQSELSESLSLTTEVVTPCLAAPRPLGPGCGDSRLAVAGRGAVRFCLAKASRKRLTGSPRQYA